MHVHVHIQGIVLTNIYIFQFLSTDQLSSTADGIELLAEDVWGALRGLETLSQIIFCSQNTVLFTLP